MRPFVSLGVPVHNGGEQLVVAVESILAQDYENLEIIISDNASTDHTWEILKGYERGDERIRLFRQSNNIGSTANFEFVLHQAQGEMFKWCAHDDVLLPGMISKCVRGLTEVPESGLCYPRIGAIDRDGNAIGEFPLIGRSLRSSDPLVRGRAAFLSAVRGGFYGVYRTRMVLGALPLPNFSYWDVLVLIYMALIGPVVEVDERLLEYRYRIRLEELTLDHDDREKDGMLCLDTDYGSLPANIVKAFAACKQGYYETSGGHGFESINDPMLDILPELERLLGPFVGPSGAREGAISWVRDEIVQNYTDLGYIISWILEYPSNPLTDCLDLIRVFCRSPRVGFSRMWWGAVRKAVGDRVLGL